MKRESGSVLIVDDEESICWGLERLLTEEGHAVSVASSAEEAFEAVGRRRPDLIVMDVRLPGMDGLSAMSRIDSLIGPTPTVVITAFGNLETAVQAMRNGAIDYLTKPFDLEQATQVIHRALGRAASVAPAPTNDDSSRRDSERNLLLGASPLMQDVFKQIALVAPTDVSVLITGESGTGKELVARAIHRHSNRAGQPCLPVNLASLSPTLIESELFGHVRGAFTGADVSRAGLLEMAHGATVFIDEAGDIPPSVQVKLLRTLEQGEVTPVGDTLARTTDFRVITATHQDIPTALKQGTLRQDFYFRLSGFEIAIPPLRKRVEDIPMLAEHFLRGASLDATSKLSFTREAMEELCRRPWPGNVRELRAAVQHGAIVARGGAICPEHLPPARPSNEPSDGDPAHELERAARAWAESRLGAGDSANLYRQFLATAEPPLMQVVMERTSQNRAAAAEILGIHRATMRKKLS